MGASIFVSYRRSDAQHAAFAIADRLRWAFGQDQVFFDRGSIEPGDDWSASIQDALHEARVVLVVMGPTWLRVADDWGRRRLDDPTDWVRREIAEALAREAAGACRVIPVYLEGARPVVAAALDAPLQRLERTQLVQLASATWEVQLEALIQRLEGLGVARLQSDGDLHPNGAPARPLELQKHRQPLPDEEVRRRLRELSFWQLCWSPHPWGLNHRAQELCKVYEFASFDDAVRFMAFAAPAIDAWAPPHHPRWENQWKVISVAFTTWDVGCRITELDFKAARDLDALYLRRPAP